MNQDIGATEGGRDWATISRDIADSPLQHAFLALADRYPRKRGLSAISQNSSRGAIIPSFLDDYGLDPYEMRVYIRLARRAGMGGQCWESISKMASSCRMSDRKLKDCLALLIAANLIKQIKRSGFTDVYELLPESHWLPPVQLDSLRTNVTASRRHSNNKRQNTPEPEIAKQGRYVTPGYVTHGYVAHGYVAHGYVAHGYVAHGYVAPTPQVLNTSVGRHSVPTPQAPGTPVGRYVAPGGQAPGTYKGIPLRNPLEDFPEDIPNTPLTPQSEKPRECVEPETLNKSVPGINQCRPRDEFWNMTDSPLLGDLCDTTNRRVVNGMPSYSEKLLPTSVLDTLDDSQAYTVLGQTHLNELQNVILTSAL